MENGREAGNGNRRGEQEQDQGWRAGAVEKAPGRGAGEEAADGE